MALHVECLHFADDCLHCAALATGSMQICQPMRSRCAQVVEGQLKLIDFGIAKAIHGGEAC